MDMFIRSDLARDAEQKAAATRGLAQVTRVTSLRVRRGYSLQITMSTTRLGGPSPTWRTPENRLKIEVFQARWAYDGAAQGGKKIAFGNTWVVAAIVVQLPFCSSPAALPVLFRLWHGKGTASQVELAAEMVKLLAGAFPGRVVHGVGDAAFHGESLIVEGATWTTRLPAN